MKNKKLGRQIASPIFIGLFTSTLSSTPFGFIRKSLQKIFDISGIDDLKMALGEFAQTPGPDAFAQEVYHLQAALAADPANLMLTTFDQAKAQALGARLGDLHRLEVTTVERPLAAQALQIIGAYLAVYLDEVMFSHPVAAGETFGEDAILRQQQKATAIFVQAAADGHGPGLGQHPVKGVAIVITPGTIRGKQTRQGLA